MCQNVRTLVVLLAGLLLLPAVIATADDTGAGGSVAVPPPRAQKTPEPVTPHQEPPKPVTLFAPAFVELEMTTIAIGIGASWGSGTLSFEGRGHDFGLKGLSLLDFGASSAVSVGDVYNLESLSDFEGHYVAFKAAAAAGTGVSTVTMRNAKGVVITLRSDLQGLQLALASQGLTIALK